MSNFIEEIHRKLASYPQARVEFDASSITVLPNSSDGFTVRLSVQSQEAGEHYTVWYNGCREATNHQGQAMNLFAFGLSSNCRLREYSRNGRAYRWIVDGWSPRRKQWEADWDTVRWCWALLSFWRRPTMRYLQNRLIDGDAAYLIPAMEQA